MSSSPPIFSPGVHTVLVPDLGPARCERHESILTAVSYLRSELAGASQVFVFTADGARCPVLRSRHLVTPDGIYSLETSAEVAEEEIDDEGYVSVELRAQAQESALPAPEQAAAPKYPTGYASMGDDDDEDEFPSL